MKESIKLRREISRLSRLMLAGGSVLLLDPTLAFAQAAADGGLEEIVVTATKRAENVQDIPMAISALSGDDIEKQGLINLEEVAKFVPSLRFVTANSPRNAGVFMRGIGQNGTNQGIEPSVGVFIDGAYLSIPGPLQTNLRDISTVEVLRGPQGTLYGRNTPVGAVNINTRAPTQDNEASITASYGDYNDAQISGYVGGGLSENLAGRLSFWAGDREGYEDNLATGDDINRGEQYGARGRLRWDAGSNVTANFIAYYTKMESHTGSPEQLDIPKLATPGFLANSAALGTPYQNFETGDHKVEEFHSGLDTMYMSGGSATFDVELGDLGTLTSITAYNWIKDDAQDPAYAGIARETLSDQGQWLERQDWSQELRLASPVDQTITYLVGIYLLKDEVDYDTWLGIGPGANRIFPPPLATVFSPTFTVGDYYKSTFKQDTHSYAAFGQLGYNITDNFRLSVGMRYSDDQKDAESNVNPTATSSKLFRFFFPPNHLDDLSYSDTEATYTATAQYDISDDVMAYVTYGTGTKSGGFNGSPVAPGIPVQFDAEKSESIEAGLKSTLWDGKLRLNVDVYRLELNDFQDSLVNPRTNSGFIVGNAGDRRSQGVEMEAQVTPFEDFTLSATLAYLDAEYTDYPDGQCYTGQVPNGSKPGSCNYDGETPYHSPDWMGSMAADYKHALGGEGRLVGFVGVDYSYTDEEYTLGSLDPRSLQDSVGLWGARAGIESADGTWRVTAYGKNLSDEAYYPATNTLILAPFIGAAAPGAVSPAKFAQANGFVGWYAPPRTYGVEVTYNFF